MMPQHDPIRHRCTNNRFRVSREGVWPLGGVDGLTWAERKELAMRKKEQAQ